MKNHKSNQKKPPQSNNPIKEAIKQGFDSQDYFQKIQQVEHHSMFSPKVVEAYGKMVPSAPERILAVFEKNSETERKFRESQAELSKTGMQYQAKDNKRRDWMAFTIIIAFLIVALLLFYLGHSWIGGGMSVTILIVVLTSAIKNYLHKTK